MPKRIVAESISIDYLKECLREENGKLFWLERPESHFVDNRAWRIWNTQNQGKEAGCKDTNKCAQTTRHRVNVGGKLLFRYQIIWAFHKNEWVSDLDHINVDPLDDRIDNLRIATPSQNGGNKKRARNNTSGYKGVSWNKTNGVYEAKIEVMGKKYHLGSFDDPAKAHQAYCEAAKKHFGEFANFG